jgi:hypothetical protein
MVDDPVLAPRHICTGEDLLTWMLSPEAGLIPVREWPASPRLTAFFCILAKLLRNKSFNKDSHGHAWTAEADLLLLFENLM